MAGENRGQWAAEWVAAGGMPMAPKGRATTLQQTLAARYIFRLRFDADLNHHRSLSSIFFTRAWYGKLMSTPLRNVNRKFDRGMTKNGH